MLLKKFKCEYIITFRKIVKQFKRAACFQININEKYSKEFETLSFSSGADIRVPRR